MTARVTGCPPWRSCPCCGQATGGRKFVCQNQTENKPSNESYRSNDSSSLEDEIRAVHSGNARNVSSCVDSRLTPNALCPPLWSCSSFIGLFSGRMLHQHPGMERGCRTTHQNNRSR